MPQAAGRRFTAGLVLGAGCLLAAAVVFAGEGVPVPRSTLVSKPELKFSLIPGERRGGRATLLVHQPAEGQAFPVAVIGSSQDLISFERLPIPEGVPDRASLDIGTLERLYVLALRQEPEARFCLADIGQSCDAAGKGDSHAELLRKLVEARQRTRPAVPWYFISMQPAATGSANADEVAVRLLREQRPMEGVGVYFNRAPHSGCGATSNAKGVAACVLVDQHGEEESSEHDGTPVVATFPGEVRKDLVLVPRTVVLPQGATAPLAKATR
jgi:hypothetical protein